MELGKNNMLLSFPEAEVATDALQRTVNPSFADQAYGLLAKLTVARYEWAEEFLAKHPDDVIPEFGKGCGPLFKAAVLYAKLQSVGTAEEALAVSEERIDVPIKEPDDYLLSQALFLLLLDEDLISPTHIRAQAIANTDEGEAAHRALSEEDESIEELDELENQFMIEDAINTRLIRANTIYAMMDDLLAAS